MKKYFLFLGSFMLALSLLAYWFDKPDDIPVKEPQEQIVFEVLSEEERELIKGIKIESDEVLLPYKRSLTVRLQNKLSEETLIKLGRLLHTTSDGYVDQLFINYYLPGMNIGEEACWAYTHFTPELEVKINNWVALQSYNPSSVSESFDTGEL